MGDGLTDDHFYDVGDGLIPRLCFTSRPSNVGDNDSTGHSLCTPHSSADDDDRAYFSTEESFSSMVGNPMRSCSCLMPHSSDVANQSIQHCSDVGDGVIPHSLLILHIDNDDHDDRLRKGKYDEAEALTDEMEEEDEALELELLSSIKRPILTYGTRVYMCS